MDSKDYIEALEKVNFEYIKLREYEPKELILGRRLFHLKENFPNLFTWVFNYYRGQIIKKKSDSITNVVPEEKIFYANPPIIECGRGAVYTCITNGYDFPIEPIYKSKNLDYFLYTDMNRCGGNNSYWICKEIADNIVHNKGSMINRYYKFHPFELFENNYDYSIYIDGNVQTVSNIDCLYSVAKDSPIGIAMHYHAGRICAYKDAEWCIYNKRGIENKIREQMKFYMDQGFPRDFGLCEGTIIVVDLSSNVAKKIMKLWWEELCRSGSRRDQLSFPYVLWKNGFSITDVGCLGNDEYHNPKFRINAHKGKLV